MELLFQVICKNFEQTISKCLVGVCHGDDLGYLFKNHVTPEIVPGSVEDVSFRRFVKLWTNFSKNGNPNNIEDPLLGIDWKPVTIQEINFIDIGNELTTGRNPEEKMLRFWDRIFETNIMHKL